MAYLSHQSGFEGQPLPDLVILDLNLRKVDGPEVLAYIRRTPELQSLRVIILSSSPEDVMKSNAEQADYYIEKPTDAASFLNLGQRIRTFYWEKASPPSSTSAT
jgi:CheY-like chemotaxis protein